MASRGAVAATVLNVIIAVLSIMAAVGSYHLYMDAKKENKGVASVYMGSLVLWLKSNNAWQQNRYSEVEEEEGLTEKQKRNRDRLETEREWLEQIGQSVGIEAATKEK